MDEQNFTNIHGKRISLDCRSHSTFCREFTVSYPKKSITRAMVSTCSVWLLAFLACAVFFTQITAVLPSATLIALAGLMVYFHFVKIDRESVLLIGSLGVQLSHSYVCGRESVTFVEMSKIKDIVINEAIYMHRIIYYLCILLKDPADPSGVAGVVPLFQSSKPRLSCLGKVYKGCQEILSDDGAMHRLADTDSGLLDSRPVVPTLQSSKPRLSCLEKVYQSYQEIVSDDGAMHGRADTDAGLLGCRPPLPPSSVQHQGLELCGAASSTVAPQCVDVGDAPPSLPSCASGRLPPRQFARHHFQVPGVLPRQPHPSLPDFVRDLRKAPVQVHIADAVLPRNIKCHS